MTFKVPRNHSLYGRSRQPDGAITPLQLAAGHGLPDMAQVLVEVGGAKVDALSLRWARALATADGKRLAQYLARKQKEQQQQEQEAEKK